VTTEAKHDPLVKAQRARRDATRESVLAALRSIEQEISGRGFYQENNGKVTLTEVARRAGVGVTTLRNRHHHETRDIVQDWLGALKQRAATTKPKARRATLEKINWYDENALRKTDAEVSKLLEQMEKLTEENKKLREQMASMKSAEGATVVGFKSGNNDND
jgi:hypothetical protein